MTLAALLAWPDDGCFRDLWPEGDRLRPGVIERIGVYRDGAPIVWASKDR